MLSFLYYSAYQNLHWFLFSRILNLSSYIRIDLKAGGTPYEKKGCQ